MNGYSGIAHIVATNFFGGPERQVLTHACSLARIAIAESRPYGAPQSANLAGTSTTIERHAHSPLLIAFTETGGHNQLVEKAQQAGIATHTLTSNTFSPALVTELAACLRAHRIGVLVSHGYKGNVIGRLATWLTGTAKIAVSRGWTGESSRVRLYERLDKLFLRFADHVVSVSHGQREKILACGVKPESVTVIHNSIDPAPFAVATPAGLRTALGIPENASFIVSAGRLSPEKGHDVMLQAAEFLRAGGTDAYYAVYGEGFMRDPLQARIHELNMEDRFFLPGFTDNIPAVMHEADIFVLPSYTEGLPNVALEASASGTPIVATAVGGTPEVVRHECNGLLVPSGDPEALALSIRQLIESPQTMQAMGHAGQLIVTSEFSFAHQMNQYQHVYASFMHDDDAILFQEAR